MRTDWLFRNPDAFLVIGATSRSSLTRYQRKRAQEIEPFFKTEVVHKEFDAI
jgi:hypothetical protein